jgi:uncharacterized membrane protein YhhN
MADSTARPARAGAARARWLAALYAALGVANYASAVRKFRAGEWATKPLLMPVLAAFLLAAAGGRRAARLPAAGMVLGGLGDTALLASGDWFLPGMGCFAAGHACYIAEFVRDGSARRARVPAAAGYGAAWAFLLAFLWRRLGSLRVPVALYSLLLVCMAILASGRNRAAAAGGALFVFSDALIACDLAGVNVVPRQDAAVMPAYLAGQFLLAGGWLRPPRESRKAPVRATGHGTTGQQREKRRRAGKGRRKAEDTGRNSCSF